MAVTTKIELEGAASPEELGSLTMNRRKMPKMAKAMTKMKMKSSLRRRRLFALVLISDLERWLDFDLGPEGGTAASPDW